MYMYFYSSPYQAREKDKMIAMNETIYDMECDAFEQLEVLDNEV